MSQTSAGQSARSWAVATSSSDRFLTEAPTAYLLRTQGALTFKFPMLAPETGVLAGTGRHEVVPQHHTDADLPAPLNLLLHPGELAELLIDAVMRDDEVDSFLLVAAINQIADDDLNRPPLGMNRLGGRWQKAKGPWRLLGSALVAAGNSATRGRALLPQERANIALQRSLAGLVDLFAHRLACRSLGVEHEGSFPDVRSLASSRAISRSRFARSVARLPTCFRSLDQRPSDCHRLVKKLLQDESCSTQTKFLVIGLRTSGSYLAPLVASYLRLEKRTDASWITVRPGSLILRHELKSIRDAISSGAHVLLVDDPPRSGASLRRLAEQIHSLGVPRDRLATAYRKVYDLGDPSKAMSFVAHPPDGQAETLDQHIEDPF